MSAESSRAVEEGGAVGERKDLLAEVERLARERVDVAGSGEAAKEAVEARHQDKSAATVPPSPHGGFVAAVEVLMWRARHAKACGQQRQCCCGLSRAIASTTELAGLLREAGEISDALNAGIMLPLNMELLIQALAAGPTGETTSEAATDNPEGR